MSGKIDKLAPPHAGSTAYINAHIVDPTANVEYRGAVLISDGKIADFGPNLFASGAPYGIQSVDCRGYYLAPGLVDTRVHTGEPGEEHKETLESAGAAATSDRQHPLCRGDWRELVSDHDARRACDSGHGIRGDGADHRAWRAGAGI